MARRSSESGSAPRPTPIVRSQPWMPIWSSMHFLRKHSTTLYLSVIGAFFAGVAAWYGAAFDAGGAHAASFDGARAYADLKMQVDFGPRIPGSQEHASAQAWIRSQLEAAGWTVMVQSST